MSLRFPPWTFTEDVNVTCVYASHTGDGMVFLFQQFVGGKDSFVVTFIDEFTYLDGKMLQITDVDLGTIEVTCRMTDALTMGPLGPEMGNTINTSATRATT